MRPSALSKSVVLTMSALDSPASVACTTAPDLRNFRFAGRRFLVAVPGRHHQFFTGRGVVVANDSREGSIVVRKSVIFDWSGHGLRLRLFPDVGGRWRGRVSAAGASCR
jgi:hypothetical protein